MNSARIGGSFASSSASPRRLWLIVRVGGGAGRLAHRVVVQLERRRGGQQRAAAVAAIGAGDARQQRHRAQRLAAIGEARHAPAQADERLLRAAIHRGEPLHIGRGNAGDGGDAVRREARQHLAFDPVEAKRVLRDVLAVAQLVAHQDVHDAEGQRGVGADADRDVPVGNLRRSRAARIDHHELHAALADLLDLRPEMHVGGEQIGAPADHQVGLDHRFRIGAADRPHRDVPRRLAATVAHRAGPQPAGAHRVEQPVRQAAVHQALMRAVAVAEQRQRSRLGDDGLPARRDLVERLVPGDRRELAFALRADAAQRRGEALGRMHQFGVAVDLGAGKAGGERLVGIALDAHHASVLDMRKQRAHVGTIVRTDHADGFHASSPKQQATDGTPSDARCDRPCCHRKARPLRATKGLSLRVPTGRQWPNRPG